MRGQTAIPVFFRSGLPATFFLHTKKEGKDVSGGIAPWTPSGLPAFFREKPAVARLPESTIKKGCGPGLGAGCIFSALRPLQLRGPRAPLLYGRRFKKKRQCRFF